MKKVLIVTSILLSLLTAVVSFAKEVPFTQDDRDRLIRLEVKIEEGLKAVNQRIDSLQQLIYVLIGVVVAQTIGVIGFVIWDRRTALQPALRKNKELEERQDRIEKALKEIAKVDSKVAEILKSVGLL
ncbi:hypothetical protein V4D30_01200 [Thermodesulfovibrio sp. 3907-1M]|uniref:Uncharacterized protein n=1 Tax=Thermodesulfovibrio autotrophicus TaxID=3118333 RepID=A0AAU8GWL8_9BACT